MALVARRSPSPAWLLDEVNSAGRENLDVDHVVRYDEKEEADAANEVALLVELGLDGRSQVVDLGAPASSPLPSPKSALEWSASTSRR